MGAAKGGKMEENSLNKQNRLPPSIPPVPLLFFLKTLGVFFLFLVTLLLTDVHKNVQILTFRFCTCVLFYLFSFLIRILLKFILLIFMY